MDGPKKRKAPRAKPGALHQIVSSDENGRTNTENTTEAQSSARHSLWRRTVDGKEIAPKYRGRPSAKAITRALDFFAPDPMRADYRKTGPGSVEPIDGDDAGKGGGT